MGPFILLTSESPHCHPVEPGSFFFSQNLLTSVLLDDKFNISKKVPKSYSQYAKDKKALNKQDSCGREGQNVDVYHQDSDMLIRYKGRTLFLKT